MNEKTIKIKQATKLGYIECKLGGCFDGSFPTSTTRRGRVQGEKGDLCPTLMASENCTIYYVEEIEDENCS